MLSWFNRKAGARAPRSVRSHRARLLVQGLENRVVPTTFPVTNADDSGPGSLRQAIEDANANLGPDDISFDPTFFNAANPRTITLQAASGQLTIAEDLIVAGPGPDILTVSGDGQVRPFNVDSSAAILNVTLSGMTVTGGNSATGTPNAGDGGGIRTTNEILTLDNVVVTGNSSGTNEGGGITATSTAFITVRNSTISGNTGERGGGIYFFLGGSLLVENSTVSGNIATDTTAANGGGGLYFFGTVAADGFTIRNSTIAGNTSGGSGGGLVLRSFNGTALIQNSTITGNTANTTSTTAGTGGGGIALSSGSASSVLSIDSSIVSGNTATAANGSSDIATIAAATGYINYSAVGDPDGFTISGSGNLAFGAVLNLLSLANNGGPTQTVALGLGSAAVDAGSNPAALTTDQRGAGFPRQVGTAVDIGAFEGTLDVPSASGGPFAPVNAAGGTTYTFDVTYSGTTPINVSTLDNNDIRVTGPNAFDQAATFVSVTPAGNGSPRTATYSITAPGGTFGGEDNGSYSINLQAGQVANTSGGTASPGSVGTFLVAIAQTLTVTNLDDAGTGSLRQAILDSNASVGLADTIVFQAGLTGTINLGSELLISDGVTLNGPGAAVVTVSGGGATRVFNVDGAGTITVAISGLTVTGGSSTADGGGIRTTDEILTLDQMVVTGNTAGANDGGGLTATGAASITVRNSTISGNTARHGGGIYFFAGGGLLLENSTLSGNSASDTAATNGGGGIYFFGTVTSEFTIRNSTIAGNTSGGSGGGLVLRTFTGTALIQNSTIAGNTANTTSTADGAGGGGIALSSGSASSVLSIDSSIVSGNTATAANGRSDIATIAAATGYINYSAVGDPDGFTISGSGNLAFGAALNLLSLANNGGPTQTVALGLGSAAVDAGTNPAALTTDQRGAGFPRQVGTAVDIGAFEGTLDVPSASGGPFAPVNAAGGTTYTFDVTYSGTTPINVSTLDNNDIRVTGPNAFDQAATFVSVTPAGNGSPRTATYSITAPGGTFGGEDNGSYSINLQAGQVANTSGGQAPASTVGTFLVAIAQTYTVTNLDDAGTGSLRQAILDSNASVGLADTIVFQSGLTGTINLGSELLITDGVTLNGPGAAVVTVSGGGATRVFNVDGAGTITVAISGLTVTGGSSTADGGGIRTTDEILTLDQMVVTGNTAGANDGGGLTATGAASITVRNSTISGNTAAQGGGIYFFSGGSLLLENSTVSGNSASDTGILGGGGIYFFGTVTSEFTIRNSTIASNTSEGSGGGLILRSFNGTALIQNSTFTGNLANTTGTGIGEGGGGIALSSGSANSILTIESSVISGNTSGNGSDDIATIAEATVNLNFSAVFDADGFVPNGGNNLAFGTDPLFDAAGLADNGGPTQTIALQSTSPLLNVGSNPASLTTDQRGAGFVRTSGTGTDIGAFELQSATAPTVVANGVVVNAGQANTTQRSRVTSIDVTFSTQVTFAGAVPTAFQLSRIGGGVVGGFTAVANVVNGRTVVTLSGFTGAETQFGSLADGRYQLTAVANQITAGGLQLDGDGNGTGGDNFVLNGTTGNGLFRFFGDVNGDGTDNAADFGPFRAAFGTSTGNPLYRDYLDFNADNTINAADFAQFRSRFGASVP